MERLQRPQRSGVLGMGWALILLAVIVLALYGVAIYAATSYLYLMYYMSLAAAACAAALWGFLALIASVFNLSLRRATPPADPAHWFIFLPWVAFGASLLTVYLLWSLLATLLSLCVLALLGCMVWLSRLLGRRMQANGMPQPPTGKDADKLSRVRLSRRTLVMGAAVSGTIGVVMAALDATAIVSLIRRFPALIPEATFQSGYAFEFISPMLPRLAWAPDGRHLAGVLHSGEMIIVDALTGQITRRLATAGIVILDFVWSSDGRQIALSDPYENSGQSAGIQLWEVDSQQLLTTYIDYGSDQDVYTGVISWTPSELILLTNFQGGREGTWLSKWNAFSDDPSQTLIEFGFSRSPDVYVVSPDHRYLAGLNGSAGEVMIWSIQTGQKIITHRFPVTDSNNPIQGLAWSPDGSRIAIGVSHNQAFIMDALSATPMQIVQGPLEPDTQDNNPYFDVPRTQAVAWSPDGASLAIVNDDMKVRVWRVEADTPSQLVFVWEGHSAMVHTVVWSPTRNLIASLDVSGIVQVWNPQGDRWALS